MEEDRREDYYERENSRNRDEIERGRERRNYDSREREDSHHHNDNDSREREHHYEERRHERGEEERRERRNREENREEWEEDGRGEEDYRERRGGGDRERRRNRAAERRLEREKEFQRAQLEKRRRQNEEDYEEDQIKIPLSLMVDKLEPSSLELLTEDKMKAFSVGLVKKSASQKAKEELEAKKKRTEDEAAKVYEEFVKDFSGESKNKSTFIRGETINNSIIKEAEGDREYNLQNNVKTSIPSVESSTPSPSSQEGAKKKRQIDELREELQRKQEVENSRKQTKTGPASFSPLPQRNPSVGNESKDQKIGPVVLSYPPSPMMPFGYAFNSSEPIQIRIFPIEDLYELATINMLASLIVEEGFSVERAVMEREKKNVRGTWRFLFQVGNSNNYYRWKIYSLMQGDSIDEWKQDSFQMYTNGPIWIPPPLKKKKEIEQKRRYNRVEKGFLCMVEELTIKRESIKEAMGFALDHTDHAEEIVGVLTESFMGKDLTISSKIARLFLASDILWNSSAPVPKASTYRTFLEAKLPTIFLSISETYRGIKGRITSQNMKDAVLKILRLWAEWSLYPPSFTKKLSAVFLEGKIPLDK
eukprot:TRINITY_DN490_c0_g2_i3.p1 TRINITY_DN490_c0_g2~~TRINITY_DN490_c0_g2_i3.p1  ORF type:complete len:591 (-),score=232.65 TRINITY_DN490_c0_g2_i3:17-1789(-)